MIATYDLPATGATDATPLLLIHGWTCDHQAMAPVAAAFPERARRSVDLLGHGATPGGGDYAIATQARAVLEVAPPRAILIGHSMGGQIAVEAAAQAPDRVAGIVLLDPAFIAPYDKTRAFGEGLRQQLARLGNAEIPAMMEAFGRRQIVRAADDAGMEALLDVMKATDPAVVRAAWSAICDWDGEAALARVRCPALVIGIDKALNRPADLIRVNKTVMTATVAGSGHMVQFEVMDQVAAMIRRFFLLNGL